MARKRNEGTLQPGNAYGASKPNIGLRHFFAWIPPASSLGGFHQAGGGFTVSGSGDIAPAVAGGAAGGGQIEQTLVGAFAGLIAVMVVGAMFITAEYRRA